MNKNLFKIIPKGIKKLANRFLEDEVLALSSQLAYALIISVFPFLIFVITLIGYLPIHSEDLLLGLKEIIPSNTYLLLKNTIEEILYTQNGNLLSFSIIFTIWTASAGFRAVVRGLNKAYDVKERRSFIKVQFMTILCTLGMALVLVMSIFLLVFGKTIGRTLVYKLGFSWEFNRIWNLIRYTVMIGSIIFILAALYYYIPNKRLKWRDVLPGAIFATIAWIIASMGFSFYVDNFNNYSRLYGSIGAVIVFLVWLYLTSIIVITGGEINALLVSNREKDLKNKNYI
ncbi:YihY/virulence factor BrkB family protein [Clostridium sporogenes]|uniref:YihY/virulence factor BrkB family protein n=1 Tax=unclassified Clostridium TaxID=2614128 RepID=UPI0013D55AB5|nr:YihY/virulence factor BrkB family protein [Clostridium sporogenes]NFS24290.1 YihY/virulence factor BrkB family protein [Clostridium sporogenes]